MGLDQYLTAKKHVSKFNYFNDYKDREITQEFQDLLPMDTPDITRYGQFVGITVEYPVGYWRKANAIHNFFVVNVGEEIDDCREMWVDRDVLVDLRDRCMEVLYDNFGKVNTSDRMEEMAKEVELETVSGFFFGDTEYGEWYREDLKLTIEICDHVLALPEEYSIYYQASW
jgi:hypothetical protein